jgi:hypothetical protein
MLIMLPKCAFPNAPHQTMASIRLGTALQIAPILTMPKIPPECALLPQDAGYISPSQIVKSMFASLNAPLHLFLLTPKI